MMSFYTGVGTSQNLQDSYAAGHEAANQALKQSGQDTIDIAIVLASSLYNQEEMLRGVRETLKNAPVVGCTSAGAITNNGPEEQAVSVLVLRSNKSKFYPIKITSISQDMRSAGKKFGEEVKKTTGGSSKLAFLFSDALAGNGTELVRGVLEVLGNDFHLAGGAAGDDMNFKKTYQYYNDEVLNDAAVGLAIEGDIKFASGADHGWQPIGNARVVTKAKGTTLYELDHKPAFLIYKDYFGDRALDFKSALSLAAVSYPLGMQTENSNQIMIRAPLSVRDDGSIVCGAEVMEGSKIYLMIGTLASALWAAENTARSLMERVLDTTKRVIFVSDCVARKILLGEHGKDELALLKNIGGPGSELFGFYSYGQIAPLHSPATDVNTCDPGFYEQSISITIFGE